MHIVGIDIGRSAIKAGVVGADFEILERVTVKTAESGKFKDIVEQVGDIIGEFATNVSYDVKGVGIGFAGRVNSSTGVIVNGTNFSHIVNVPFASIFQERFMVPVFLQNDVKVQALAEHTFGAARAFSHFLFIALGTGIGGAIFVDGRLVEGRDGLAGEVGHFIMGDNKHFEQVASEVRGGNTDPKHIAAVADVCATVFTGLIHTFNPEALVIGGGVAKAGDRLFVPLRKKLKELVFPEFYRHLQIIPGSLGDDAGILGAALLVHSREVSYAA